NGTFVNGDQVTEAVLKPFDEIAAGQSTFAVNMVESKEPRPAIKPAALPRVGAISAESTWAMPARAGGDILQSGLVAAPKPPLQVLRAQSGPLYAVVDGARNGQILPMLLMSNEEYQCLYEGKSADDLASLAPYLVRLPPES